MFNFQKSKLSKNKEPTPEYEDSKSVLTARNKIEKKLIRVRTVTNLEEHKDKKTSEFTRKKVFEQIRNKGQK